VVKEVVGRQIGVDLAQPLRVDGAEVISFGRILSDNPVIVLRTALFPGMVGFAKEALQQNLWVNFGSGSFPSV
jgi:cell wall assembly regulator SMI1